MMRDKIIQNLRDTLLLFGSLPSAECVREGEGLFYCSHIPAAGENYLLLPEGGNARDSLDRGIAFFAERATPFICPALSEEKTLAPLLENSGMRERARLTGMIRNLGELEGVDETDAEIALLNGKDDPKPVAEALWRGFDSEEDAPASFVSFVRGALSLDGVRLYVARENGEIAATTMLTQTRHTAGIYYVATLPAFRRRGIGQRLMRRALMDAKSMEYEHACLLATASGYPLYLRCGFLDIFSAGVYSHTEEL